MKKLVNHLISQHFLVNLITLVILIGGIISWNTTNKEELPDVTFNIARISTTYSGASAADIEFFITKPIEESLQGLDGIRQITSTSSPGNSSVAVELEQSVKDIDKKITEIQSQLSSVKLPNDILNDPQIRLFETSKKAIIDIAIYNQNTPLLSVNDRIELQQFARGLETKLLSQPEIFEIRRQGYLKEEINIIADPSTFNTYDLSLNSIAKEIIQSHVRAPAGTLKSGQFEQVSILSELNERKTLNDLVIQGGFDSNTIALKSLATIEDGFETQRSIYKVNGREAILFDVVKSSQIGILDGLEIVKKVVSQYQEHTLKNRPITISYLDDESIDIRNRLNIISSNGLLGFCLILITLFIFLNKQSGFWVALGIPFTLCFTMITTQFMGYTVNGVTLAAVIIVLGIVVDDAIIVAENITQRYNKGDSIKDAALYGTLEVIPPIIASILTTCAAFIPLYFFTGRFGNFVKYIPPVIFIMLFASLLESFFLLPSHLTLFSRKKIISPAKTWFKKWENNYEKILHILLPKRYWIILLFIIAIVASGVLAKNEFKFVLFPNEESREIVISGQVDTAKNVEDTARSIQDIEEYLLTYIGKEGVAIRSEVAKGRRGAASIENEFRITLEITAKDKRKKTSQELITEIESKIKSIPSISNLKFRRNRYGQASGSVFEIVVAENDDIKREELVNNIIEKLTQNTSLINLEKDIIPVQKEYELNFKQEELKRLSINPSSITSTLRTILNGKQLYTLIRQDEEINVNLTVADYFRSDLKSVLKIPVENNRNYLVPLEDILSVEQIEAKKSIRRQNLKRTSYIYADLAPDADKSPLDIAEELENNTFPELLASFPLSDIYFDGEIIDTRQSKQDLKIGITASLSLIYLILAILFNSAVKPLRIMLVIPFGIIGVIVAFYLHQKLSFGFYAAIGSLGMLGVVVNDAIVMLDRLDKTQQTSSISNETFTAHIAKTRLRAIILTTITTVAGVIPTAYGLGGYDTMLADMMLALGWGLIFGTLITLILIPCTYLIEHDIKQLFYKIKPNKISPIIPLLFLFFISSNPIYATTTVLTKDDFITKAMKHDGYFHTLLIDRLYFQYDNDINIQPSELLFTINSKATLNDQTRSDHNHLGLLITLPTRGQSMGFSLDNSTSTSTPSFTFSQDIARNAFGKQIKLSTHIQQLKTAVAKHQLVEAYEDYVAELISLYYTWIRQYESVQLAQAAYNENEKVLKSILDRQKRNIANQTDVNKLKLQLLSKQEQLIAFERDYKEITLLIAESIQETNVSNLYPDTTIILEQLPSSFEKEIEQIKQQSRTFSILNTLKKQAALDYKKLEHDLLPSASLSASMSHNESTSGYVKLEMDLPLKNTASKAKLESAAITIQKTNSNSLDKEDALKQTLQSLFNRLMIQKKLIQIAIEKKDIAFDILEAESEHYSYGKISLNDYITAVNRYDTARFDEVDKEISYQKLFVEWQRLSDTLIVKSVDEL